MLLLLGVIHAECFRLALYAESCMLNVLMLGVFYSGRHYAVCFKLTLSAQLVMLNVIMLNVVTL